MARKKKGKKIQGCFVPLEHRLLDSRAFHALTNNSKIAFTYFRRDRKNGYQMDLTLTLKQAKGYGVCGSPTTFTKIKRELVAYGFLDPLNPGGLNEPAVFRESSRWKKWGTPEFEEKEYQAGIGSKYFQTIWKDPERARRLINARHKKKPNTESI